MEGAEEPWENKDAVWKPPSNDYEMTEKEGDLEKRGFGVYLVQRYVRGPNKLRTGLSRIIGVYHWIVFVVIRRTDTFGNFDPKKNLIAFQFQLNKNGVCYPQTCTAIPPDSFFLGHSLREEEDIHRFHFYLGNELRTKGYNLKTFNAEIYCTLLSSFLLPDLPESAINLYTTNTKYDTSISHTTNLKNPFAKWHFFSRDYDIFAEQSISLVSSSSSSRVSSPSPLRPTTPSTPSTPATPATPSTPTTTTPKRPILSKKATLQQEIIFLSSDGLLSLKERMGGLVGKGEEGEGEGEKEEEDVCVGGNGGDGDINGRGSGNGSRSLVVGRGRGRGGAKGLRNSSLWNFVPSSFDAGDMIERYKLFAYSVPTSKSKILKAGDLLITQHSFVLTAYWVVQALFSSYAIDLFSNSNSSTSLSAFSSAIANSSPDDLSDPGSPPSPPPSPVAPSSPPPRPSRPDIRPDTKRSNPHNAPTFFFSSSPSFPSSPPSSPSRPVSAAPSSLSTSSPPVSNNAPPTPSPPTPTSPSPHRPSSSSSISPSACLSAPFVLFPFSFSTSPSLSPSLSPSPSSTTIGSRSNYYRDASAKIPDPLIYTDVIIPEWSSDLFSLIRSLPDKDLKGFLTRSLMPLLVKGEGGFLHVGLAELVMFCSVADKTESIEALVSLANSRIESQHVFCLDVADAMTGFRPLHIAVALGYSDMINLLLKLGADWTAVDWKKRSPLELAKEIHEKMNDQKSKKIVRLLDNLAEKLIQDTLSGEVAEEFGVKNYVKMLAGVHKVEVWEDILGAEGVIVHKIIRDHRPRPDEVGELLGSVVADPLKTPSRRQQIILWRYRKQFYALDHMDRMLVKILLSVKWSNPKYEETIQKELEDLPPTLKPISALELLFKFQDKNRFCVKNYAIKCLERADDHLLSKHLLLFVQLLKFEHEKGSILEEFLLKRAIENPFELGCPLYWHLQTEKVYASGRFETILKALLKAFPDILGPQRSVIQQLRGVCDDLKKAKPYNPKAEAQKLLSSVKLPSSFTLPLDYHYVVGENGLVIDGCKTMDSAKMPLWLVFETPMHGRPPMPVLFKTGDDLRQDILTLQLLNIMNDLWKKENCDCFLMPYDVISTGENEGMIQVVRDSTTIADIQKLMGYGYGSQAFQKDSLVKWLKKVNNIEKLTKDIVENFMRSCAGYSVATYVLGIGDRHNDNIMMSKSGNLFHIDFGHFLGHKKTFLGMSRESAPFVFPPPFVQVLGGTRTKNFAKFVVMCCDGYEILRRHVDELMNWLLIMSEAGIPELPDKEGIEILRATLATDQVEPPDFANLIHDSLDSVGTSFNFAAHILVHPS